MCLWSPAPDASVFQKKMEVSHYGEIQATFRNGHQRKRSKPLFKKPRVDWRRARDRRRGSVVGALSGRFPILTFKIPRGQIGDETFERPSASASIVVRYSTSNNLHHRPASKLHLVQLQNDLNNEVCRRHRRHFGHRRRLCPRAGRTVLYAAQCV